MKHFPVQKSYLTVTTIKDEMVKAGSEHRQHTDTYLKTAEERELERGRKSLNVRRQEG